MWCLLQFLFDRLASGCLGLSGRGVDREENPSQKELGGCCDSGGIADAFPATPMERRDSTVGADQVDLFELSQPI